jgi:TAT (twin-arginine translocation) pathway signal sequence
MTIDPDALPPCEGASHGMSRRTLLKSGLAAAAGGLVLPAVGVSPARDVDSHAQTHAFAPDAVMATP